jgi:hypothetical protein
MILPAVLVLKGRDERARETSGYEVKGSLPPTKAASTKLVGIRAGTRTVAALVVQLKNGEG